MTRWKLVLAFTLVTAFGAGAGYWLGFREAWQLGVMADTLPRGVIASQQLKALHAGKPENVIVGLEFDVDNGLLWGGDLIENPITKLLGPVWGIDVSASLEGYAVRLANYRKQNPSLMKSDMFNTVPPGKEQYREFYRQLANDADEQIAKLNARVQRYAVNP
jgi:hypothetical protein